MKCKAKYRSNWREMEAAEKLGMPVPEPDLIYDDIIFNPANVEAIDKTDRGEIRVWLVSGQQFTIEYSDEIWNKFEELWEKKS